MSNELNNIIARSTDGVYEGIAIGGDRYDVITLKLFITKYFTDREEWETGLLYEIDT